MAPLTLLLIPFLLLGAKETQEKQLKTCSSHLESQAVEWGG